MTNGVQSEMMANQLVLTWKSAIFNIFNRPAVETTESRDFLGIQFHKLQQNRHSANIIMTRQYQLDTYDIIQILSVISVKLFS